MFFKATLVCFALVASAFATPVKRAEGIAVKVVPASSSVDTIDDLKFTASISNTGVEAVKILNYGTILDSKLPTKSFVVKKDGQTVPFTGVKLSVSLTEADDSAFTVINPGQTVIVTHEVAALYDFASVGTGKYSFEPITTFLFASSPSAEKKEVATALSFSKAQADANVVEVEITGGLHKRELKQLESRARDICTTASRKSFIDASYTEAKTLASTALSYISSRGASDATYRAYFGANPTSRVTSILTAVANENSSSRTLSCTDTYGVCSGGVIAYTVTSTTNIYFCSIFFNEVPSTSLCSGTTVASRNVRGGTTLHEMTHAVGGTDDIGYGCAADQGLSDSNKLANADNFNCFTTQVYASTRC